MQEALGLELAYDKRRTRPRATLSQFKGAIMPLFEEGNFAEHLGDQGLPCVASQTK